MKPEPQKSPKSLDELLELDATPVMGEAARARLVERLAEARSGSGDTLDVVLAFDRVDPPAGLAERIIDRVRQEELTLTPAPAPAQRWRPRLLLPVALPLVGAAAALTLILMRGGASDSVAEISDPAPMVEVAAEVAAELDIEVSDELLASLSVLEDMDFLTEELDPFDADALFLFEAEDQVLMDLLVSEGYGPDGVSDGSGERR